MPLRALRLSGDLTWQNKQRNHHEGQVLLASEARSLPSRWPVVSLQPVVVAVELPLTRFGFISSA